MTNALLKTKHETVANVVHETLSDGSIVHNVAVVIVEAKRVRTLTFACLDRRHAQELAFSINACSWVEEA